MSCPELEPTATTPLDGRSRIVAAARTLFLANGFKSVSMQQIADAAGVNKATLYHHFTDKEALFVDVMRQAFATGYADMSAITSLDAPLPEQLQRVAAMIFTAPPGDMSRLMADLREHVSPERRQTLVAENSPPWTVLTDLIAAASAKGEIRPVDPVLAGRAFFIMVVSQLSWNKFAGGNPPDEATAAALVDLLMNGLARPCAPAAVSETAPGQQAAELAVR